MTTAAEGQGPVEQTMFDDGRCRRCLEADSLAQTVLTLILIRADYEVQTPG